MNEHSSAAAISQEQQDKNREFMQRNTALSAALGIYASQGDHQMVIRAARDILAFLKDG